MYRTREKDYRRYSIIKEIGQGTEGFVYMVIDNTSNELLAMKLVDKDDDFLKIDSFAEIKINQQLAVYKNYTDAILYPIEFYFDNLMLDYSILPSGTENLINLTYAFTMPIGLGDISDFNFTVNDYPLIFELLYGYLILQHNKKFVFNDVISDNIIIRNVNYSRIYTIRGTKYIIDNPYMLSMIDFSDAEYNAEDRKMNFDRNSIINIFIENTKDIKLKLSLENIKNKPIEYYLELIPLVFSVYNQDLYYPSPCKVYLPYFY